MRLVFAALLACACGCGRDEGVKDEDLGNLVIDRKPRTTVDVETATKDPAELSRALANPYSAVVAALGPHAMTIETKTLVEEGGKPAANGELSDKAELELGDAGAFHGLYNNSADYGREAIYVAGKLYLRPRYQKWHGRAPESADEPAQIRDAYFAAIGATWDLVAPGAELSDRGPATVAGRVGRKISVKLAPTPRDNPRETQTQRLWRESRSITALDGEVVLDSDKGVPLAAKLTATISFSRDGRRFAMKLALDAQVTKLGAATVTAPAETEVVATPTRRGEVDERDYLLHGIAPPIKKNKDGTAKPTVAPTPTGSGSGSAVKPEPKLDDKKPAKKKSERKKSADEKSDEKSEKKKSPTDTKPDRPEKP